MQKSDKGIAQNENGSSRSHLEDRQSQENIEDHLLLWLVDGVLETSRPYHLLFVFAGAKGHRTRVSVV